MSINNSKGEGKNDPPRLTLPLGTGRPRCSPNIHPRRCFGGRQTTANDPRRRCTTIEGEEARGARVGVRAGAVRFNGWSGMHQKWPRWDALYVLVCKGAELDRGGRRAEVRRSREERQSKREVKKVKREAKGDARRGEAR
ncbi:hypothetical protein E2C01_100797 [Portunus trituberculatus]|uniref:Uncharacterized protein n=1 Tax=Portunus trituberculatus TaxID=210409 RepID=A0A5B7KE89_PORTR|nr:hypothetical protein [Portunus trituberculatus]